VCVRSHLVHTLCVVFFPPVLWPKTLTVTFVQVCCLTSTPWWLHDWLKRRLQRVTSPQTEQQQLGRLAKREVVQQQLPRKAKPLQALLLQRFNRVG
jgi:hypothetical protein